uniref:Plasminogen n=1 Tax=Athene cunicularia TaxID=194338 RepID=A0A663MQJ1_ATHCN
SGFYLTTHHIHILQDNYCRNPDGDSSPWCFTTDPTTTWEYCSLKRCDDHIQEHAPNDPPATMAGLTTPTTSDCINGNGKDYRGTVAKTGRGRTCQEWSSQKPHSHKYFTPVTHPRAGLEENYCRNPDNDEKGPWCYTTDPATRFDYCNIPECEGTIIQPCVLINFPQGLSVSHCMHCSGENYHGEVATTVSGIECQRWDSQKPHSHGYLPENFPEKDLKMNYCRNPDGEPRPWCFTTNPTKRWEYCDIPRCKDISFISAPTPVPITDGPATFTLVFFTCLSGKGEDYRGTISVTESGNTCQRWSSQFPHRHARTPENYPCNLEENYCRNPDGEKMPWCYTTNRTARWEYCTIPSCDGTEPETFPDPREAQITEECYQGNGVTYRGTASFTLTGKKCQAWSSMSPHRHNKTADQFPNADLKQNYCRNPDADSRPWCYTTDPSVRWEYCNLKKCDDHVQVTLPKPPQTTQEPNPEMLPNTLSKPSLAQLEAIPSYCINGNGKDYRGTVAKTGRGRTCQEWSSQRPHSHDYFTPITHPGAGLDKNVSSCSFNTCCH